MEYNSRLSILLIKYAIGNPVIRIIYCRDTKSFEMSESFLFVVVIVVK